jgi:peptidoglycan/xylan/chitin deacetylase (PgdA/CDA1 family)
MADMHRRKILLGAGALLAAPAVAGRARAQSFTEASLPARGDITTGRLATVRRIATGQPLVALTFDDGPHHSLTPQLLDLLSAYEVRATFYVIGSRVARHPQLAARIASEGHEIGNHTWSHPSLFGYSDAGVLSQVDRTSRAVIDATGRMPVTLRPPYGDFYPRQSLMLFQARGMPTVFWSVDPEDWRRPASAVVASRIVNGSRPGDIVLSHDIHGPTVRAMPATIEGLAARGFRFVTVSELIGWPRWDRRRLRVSARVRQG